MLENKKEQAIYDIFSSLYILSNLILLVTWMIFFSLEDYIYKCHSNETIFLCTILIPPHPLEKKTPKQTKSICYLQYVHKVQGGTSKYHAFKIVVQKIIIILF